MLDGSKLVRQAVSIVLIKIIFKDGVISQLKLNMFTSSDQSERLQLEEVHKLVRGFLKKKILIKD